MKIKQKSIILLVVAFILLMVFFIRENFIKTQNLILIKGFKGVIVSWKRP